MFSFFDLSILDDDNEDIAIYATMFIKLQARPYAITWNTASSGYEPNKS